jgi:DNA primase
MPSLDFQAIREAVSISQVLEIVGFVAAEQSGDQVRGPCPVHGSTSPASRSLSANLRRNTFQCFKCGAKGNQLDLYAAITGLPIHEAALQLCEKAGVDLQQVLLSPTKRPLRPRGIREEEPVTPVERETTGYNSE